jgi:hypothetical protein
MMDERREKLKRSLEGDETVNNEPGGLVSRGVRAPLWAPTDEELARLGRQATLNLALAMALGTADRMFHC